ncbi:MAG: NUDIX hydrolase [Candidatus Gracilibacteria bacterium]|jgi:8-oxo-dGTP pyrophosphatase MutT (NUDIX family)
MWKTISKKTILKTKVFFVTEETCAKKDKTIINNFYVIHPKNVVVIIPLTEKNEVVVIKQYRHSVKKTDYELPAGHIENKDKKNIKQAAIRELLEETGYKPKTLKLIYTAYSSIGKQDNKVFYFLAKGCKKIQEQTLEKDEEIETKVMSIKKSLQLMDKNKFKDNHSVCAMLLLKNLY